MHGSVAETACGPIEYTEAGTGPPVLYFHGTGVTGDVMLPVESRVVDDGFRLIIPNRPGYGRTPLERHDSLLGCGEVFAALLNTLGLSEVSVMASSGGAAFAASFAVHHPARVKCLVLLCPQLHRWDHKRWLPAHSRWTLPILRRPLLRKGLLRLYRFQLARQSVGQFLKTEAGTRYTEVADDPRAREICELTLKAMASGTRWPGFENDFLVFMSEEIFDAGASLPSPTLVLHDPADPLAPLEHVEWFASRVPHCSRVSLHTAGHLVWLGEQAELMHETRMRFLREHTAGFVRDSPL